MPSQTEAALPPELRPFQASARRNIMVYLVICVGAGFIAVPLSVDPARHCLEYACPQWLHLAALGLGVLSVLGGVTALIRNTRCGSRLDLAARALVWWVGVPPFKESRIPLDDIATVLWDTSGDSNQLSLRDRAGKRLYVPEDCLRSPHQAWAQALAATFPHISYEHKA